MSVTQLTRSTRLAPAGSHNIEAEQAVLGAILINNEAAALVKDIVAAGDFYEPIHGQVYATALELIQVGKAATPVTIKMFLDFEQKLGDSTVGGYVAHLMAEATTIINAPDYARVVRDCADRRRIAEVGAILSDRIMDPDETARGAIEYLDGILNRRLVNASPSVLMPEASAAALDAISEAFQRDGRISGVTYGLVELDRKTLGLQDGEMAIMAGRPGMGKTALGLGIARAASLTGKKVRIASLEMGRVPLTQRMISDELFEMGHNLPYSSMRSGRFDEKTFEHIVTAGRRIGSLPITIDDRGGQTVAQIAGAARLQKRRSGLDLLIVDHLHLIKASGNYRGNRVNEIGEMTSELKALAKELDIPVLVLCQLSRAVEGRDDKKPTMADLRGSGDIEQDADLVLMLYREHYYLERSEPDPSKVEQHANWAVRLHATANLLQVFVEKQRNGPVGEVKVFCNIACNAVRDLATEPAPAPQPELL